MFKFLKESSQLIYSLLLIIVIPIAIVWFGLWNISNFQKVDENQIKQESILQGKIIATAVSEHLSDERATQAKLAELAKSDPKIKEISILKPYENSFLVTSSTETKSVGLNLQSEDNLNSWLNDKTLATLERTDNSADSERVWRIISPVQNNIGQKSAILNLKVSMQESDALSRQNVVRSLTYLAILMGITLLLLANHFRFFEYALMYRKLKEVDRMKDDFINVASHELKTPMTAIKGYLGMIFEGVAGKVDDKAREHLDKVFANVKRLDVLVNELLDVSRLEQGRIQFDMQEVEPEKIAAQVISELIVNADEKKIYLKQTTLPVMPKIFIDPDRYSQILHNLIGNAIKYTDKGGIEIVYQIDKNDLKISVKDSGIGIAPADQKGLFQKFYRVHNEKTMDVPGTGLGLWITKELINRMNGKIEVASQENVGSTFTVSFPIIKGA